MQQLCVNYMLINYVLFIVREGMCQCRERRSERDRLASSCDWRVHDARVWAFVYAWSERVFEAYVTSGCFYSSSKSVYTVLFGIKGVSFV